MIIASCSLIGCGNSNNHSIRNESTESVTNIVPKNESNNLVALSDRVVTASNLNVIFNSDEIIPVITNGSNRGYLKLNWVQKLGIWDPCNATACANGIKTSYTINMNVDFSESIGSAQNNVITIKPYLIDTHGKTVGSPCNLGWSGFSTTAQLFDKNVSANIEVGLQPEVLDDSDTTVLFKISDSDGNKYDDIYVSSECLKNAEMKQSIIQDGASATITAINGAKFNITVGDVSVNIPVPISQQDIKDLSKVTYYYDYNYNVKYESGPSNDSEDLLFDSNNGNQLHSQFITFLTTDTDNTRLYDGDSSITRQLYYDRDKLFSYVTTDFQDLNVGDDFTVICNKAIISKTGNPDYVRVCFEFPEEVEARTLDEMKDFDGRFLIFMCKISERELEYFYTEK